jgi:peptidoglycan hydrolase CwlO-like protein
MKTRKFVVILVVFFAIGLFTIGYCEDKTTIEPVTIQDLESQQLGIIIEIKASLWDIQELNKRINALNERQKALQARYAEIAEQIKALRTGSDLVDHNQFVE